VEVSCGKEAQLCVSEVCMYVMRRVYICRTRVS